MLLEWARCGSWCTANCKFTKTSRNVVYSQKHGITSFTKITQKMVQNVQPFTSQI